MPDVNGQEENQETSERLEALPVCGTKINFLGPDMLQRVFQCAYGMIDVRSDITGHQGGSGHIGTFTKGLRHYYCDAERRCRVRCTYERASWILKPGVECKAAGSPKT